MGAEGEVGRRERRGNIDNGRGGRQGWQKGGGEGEKESRREGIGKTDLISGTGRYRGYSLCPP